MATASVDQLVDITVLHQVGLQRFSTHVIRRIVGTLRLTAADLERQIREHSPIDPGERRDHRSYRLTKLLEQVQTTQREAHRAIRGDLDGQWSGLAATESAFINGLSRIAVGTDALLATVSAEQMRAAVMSRPFQGKVLADWTSQFEAGDLRRIREQIVIGYLEGEGIGSIAKRVRVAGEITKSGAEALVRTTVTHFNAQAVRESAAANPTLFPKYQWISVLDNRTTPICQSRAGRVYRHGEGPMPPAHVRCRSTAVNLVAGVWPAEDIGFSDWFSRQGADVQEDILGPTRYKLFRAGEMKYDRFTDAAGKRYTLEELKARDAEAFRRAGL